MAVTEMIYYRHSRKLYTKKETGKLISYIFPTDK